MPRSAFFALFERSAALIVPFLMSLLVMSFAAVAVPPIATANTAARATMNLNLLSM